MLVERVEWPVERQPVVLVLGPVRQADAVGDVVGPQ